MTQQQNIIDAEQKTIPRRKLINKVRRKVKRQNQRIAQTYKSFENNPKSALNAILNPLPVDQNDFDMLNHISLGQNRRMKKRMKKLKKKFGDNNDKIFNDLQKYKQNIYRQQQKSLFSPVNEMEKRRQKRMKRMQANARRSKTEVNHKNKAKNSNYKLVVKGLKVIKKDGKK